MFKKKGLRRQEASLAANTVVNKIQTSLDFRMRYQ
jgi:hypothetical protein